MRIALNAGGLGGVAISAFQSDAANLSSKIDGLIVAFAAVKSKTCNLNGGVGRLGGALDSIQARISTETARKEAATAAQTKVNSFLSLAIRVDNQVASAVTKNKEAFYKVNPWLKPASDKPWYENAWNWLNDNVFTPVGEFLLKAGELLFEFIKDHWKEILIGLAAIVIGAVLTVLTGGAFLPALLAGLKAAAIAGLISGGVSAGISVVGSCINGEDFGTALGNAFNAFGDGFASGFMWGGIMAGGSQAFASVMRFSRSGSITLLGKNIQFFKPNNFKGFKIGNLKIWSPNSLGNPNSGGTLLKIGDTFRIDFEVGKQLFHTHISHGLFNTLPKFVQNMSWLFDPARADVHVRLVGLLGGIMGVSKRQD